DRLRFSESVTGDVTEGVLVVTIDNPPVNATSAHVRQGLAKALSAAADRDDIEAIVVTGAGRIFVGGADIREFGQPPVEPSLPEVLNRIEDFPKPVVAAVNGAALGGGCEIALACHGRVAGQKATFGLPEVKLGIVPGAGGTQRLPRLVGVPAAIDMIGSGRSVKPAEALKLGLVDKIAADPVAEAIDLARAMASAPLRRTGALAVPAADASAVEASEKKVLSKARGQQSPAEAVRLV